MLSTLLDISAVAVIGLLSYIWISNYYDKPKGGNTGGDATNNTTKDATTAGATGGKGKPSRAGVIPPALPKRSEAQQAAIHASTATHTTTAAAAATTDADAPMASPSASANTPEQKRAAKANLLAMAMSSSAPALPKRPMINILHAPTLTESVAFSPAGGEHTQGDSSSAASSSTAAASDKDALDASKAAKLADHRKQVQWELVSSEEKYIGSLNTLMQVYFTPLKVKVEKGSDKINAQEHASLFSNVEAIWKFHVMMLPALKTSPEGDVASVIHAHADYMKMYTKYVADYSNALNTVNKLYKNEGFLRLIKKQRENPAAQGLDLMSFLIMPVQRVPRYLLLLKELQKFTPPSHPHSASITSAIAKIGKIASFINETQRQQENASLLLEFQSQIHQLPDDIHLFEPHRKLVRHGLLRLLKQEGTTNVASLAQEIAAGENFMCILFNDMILYTTLNWDYRGMLKLQGATLNTSEMKLELVREKTSSHRVQSSLRLGCPSDEEASRWAASLTDSIKAANELGQQDERRKSAASNSFSSK